ncbi:MAG: glycosyltransferase [Burkholderiaceae bacterium]|nr:MAG: glycosyltransferase [Burkholderiaceae bacterium]
MRILVLCDRFPWPLTNGQNLRIYHYVNALKGRHQFDLLCYGDIAAIPPEIHTLFGRIDCTARPRAQKFSGVRKLWSAFDMEQFVLKCPRTTEQIACWQREQPYDLIWISGWDMVVNLPPGLQVPVLMDAVDDGLLEHRREVHTAPTLKRRLHALKLLWMNYRFEKRYFAPQDGVLFVSERDAASFQAIAPHTKVFVVHNGVDTDYFAPLGLPKRAHTVIFEGNISFGPNYDGLLYFCNDILPLIRARCPDVALHIVGRDPPAEIQALATARIGEPGIVVTGFVDDVRPYLDQATVFVCPLRKGAGIKNKLLQAWSIGLPIVATSITLGGLKAEPEQNVVVADTPQAFADAVLRVFADAVLRQRLSENARTTALSHYSWQQKAQELETVMLSLARPQHTT